MLCADLLVPKAAGSVLSQDNDLTGTLCEPRIHTDKDRMCLRPLRDLLDVCTHRTGDEAHTRSRCRFDRRGAVFVGGWRAGRSGLPARDCLETIYAAIEGEDLAHAGGFGLRDEISLREVEVVDLVDL